MRRLWEPATVRRLRDAVKRRSPDDWKASRKLRLAQLRRHRRVPGDLGWMVVGFIGLIAVLWAPVFPAARLSETAALGLLAWHLTVVGLFFGSNLLSPPEVDVSPLSNTPIGLASVYRYVLGKIRRSIARRVVWGWLMTLAVAGVLLVVDRPADWIGAGIRLFGASFILYALSAQLAMIPRLLPWSGWGRISGMIGVSFVVIVIWLLFCLEKEWMMPPEAVGQAFAILPQSAICRWIAGGDLPIKIILCGLAGGLLLGAALGSYYRDRSAEVGADEPSEEPELTAEFVAAAAIKDWRGRLLKASLAEDDEDEDSDEDDDEEEPSSRQGSEPEVVVKPPLLLHPHAPRLHGEPVSAEFRLVMACEVRRLLDLPEGEGPGEEYRRFRGWTIPPIWRSARWAVLAGFLGPLFLFAALICREHHAPGWIASGLNFGVAAALAHLLLTPVAPSFGLPAFQLFFTGLDLVVAWACLPLPLRTHYEAFREWSRIAHRRRWALCAAGFVGAVVSAHLVLGLLLALGLAPRQCPGFSRLWEGPLSLTQFGALLLTTLAVFRAFRIQPFAAAVSAQFRGRGAWKLVYAVSVVCFLVAGICTGCAGGLVMAGIASKIPFTALTHWPWPWPWIGAVVLLAAGEIARLLAVQLYLHYAARAKGEYGSKV